MQTTTYKINNEDLQHSTENYIQCPVINYNGNESEATYLKLTQCCKSTVVKLKKKKETGSLQPTSTSAIRSK